MIKTTAAAWKVIVMCFGLSVLFFVLSLTLLTLVVLMLMLIFNTATGFFVVSVSHRLGPRAVWLSGEVVQDGHRV